MYQSDRLVFGGDDGGAIALLLVSENGRVAIFPLVGESSGNAIAPLINKDGESAISCAMLSAIAFLIDRNDGSALDFRFRNLKGRALLLPEWSCAIALLLHHRGRSRMGMVGVRSLISATVDREYCREIYDSNYSWACCRAKSITRWLRRIL